MPVGPGGSRCSPPRGSARARTICEQVIIQSILHSGSTNASTAHAALWRPAVLRKSRPPEQTPSGLPPPALVAPHDKQSDRARPRVLECGSGRVQMCSCGVGVVHQEDPTVLHQLALDTRRRHRQERCARSLQALCTGRRPRRSRPTGACAECSRAGDAPPGPAATGPPRPRRTRRELRSRHGVRVTCPAGRPTGATGAGR